MSASSQHFQISGFMEVKGFLSSSLPFFSALEADPWLLGLLFMSVQLQWSLQQAFILIRAGI